MKFFVIGSLNMDLVIQSSVAPRSLSFTKAEILKAVHFQEQYFDVEIAI